MEWADVIRDARLQIAQNPGCLPYRTVIADEVQDLRQADLALLRAIVPENANDLFVVGDAHQRIHGHPGQSIKVTHRVPFSFVRALAKTGCGIKA